MLISILLADMRKGILHSLISITIYITLVIIAFRVLFTGQYKKSGVITLHVRLKRESELLYRNQKIHSYDDRVLTQKG
jgi:hypothetical protein